MKILDMLIDLFKNRNNINKLECSPKLIKEEVFEEIHKVFTTEDEKKEIFDIIKISNSKRDIYYLFCDLLDIENEDGEPDYTEQDILKYISNKNSESIGTLLSAMADREFQINDDVLLFEILSLLKSTNKDLSVSAALALYSGGKKAKYIVCAVIYKSDIEIKHRDFIKGCLEL